MVSITEGLEEWPGNAIFIADHDVGVEGDTQTMEEAKLRDVALHMD